MGQKWTLRILPTEIWHITDGRDCSASCRAVHCTQTICEEMPLPLAWAQTSGQVCTIKSPLFVTGGCTLYAFCCEVFTTPSGSKKCCQESSLWEILTYFYIWHPFACQDQVDYEQTFSMSSAKRSSLTLREGNSVMAKQTESGIANSQRLNFSPPRPPSLSDAKKICWEMGVEVASSVCLCVYVFYPFLAASS